MKTIISTILIFLFTMQLSFAQTDSLTIGVSEKFFSTILNEKRTINIYLPENYNQNDTVKYPVIYILDGGIKEDFFHITGIVQYNTQPWINRFPRSIVVGIENSNRQRDFTFPVSNLDFLEKVGFKKEKFPVYGGSANYISFLENELLPYIRDKFKTNQERTIIGESLAGLMATEILMKHPDLFNTYIISSPSLWWGNEVLLKDADNLLNEHLKTKIKVCVIAPNKKEDKIMYNDAKSLYKSVKRNENISSFFEYLPDELHSTVIHLAVYNAFKMIYPKTEFSR